MVTRDLTWAGEFVAGLSWHRLIAVSTSGSAPRSCHDPSRRTVAEYANPRASRRRSGPPDAIREPSRPSTVTALIDGQNGLQTCLIQCIIESSSESSPSHCRFVHQRRDSSPGVSAACRTRAIRERPRRCPQIHRRATVFVTRTSWSPMRRRRIRDSSHENGATG